MNEQKKITSVHLCESDAIEIANRWTGDGYNPWVLERTVRAGGLTTSVWVVVVTDYDSPDPITRALNYPERY